VGSFHRMEFVSLGREWEMSREEKKRRENRERHMGSCAGGTFTDENGCSWAVEIGVDLGQGEGVAGVTSKDKEGGVGVGIGVCQHGRILLGCCCR